MSKFRSNAETFAYCVCIHKIWNQIFGIFEFSFLGHIRGAQIIDARRRCRLFAIAQSERSPLLTDLHIKSSLLSNIFNEIAMSDNVEKEAHARELTRLRVEISKTAANR